MDSSSVSGLKFHEALESCPGVQVSILVVMEEARWQRAWPTPRRTAASPGASFNPCCHGSRPAAFAPQKGKPSCHASAQVFQLLVVMEVGSVGYATSSATRYRQGVVKFQSLLSWKKAPVAAKLPHTWPVVTRGARGPSFNPCCHGSSSLAVRQRDGPRERRL